MTGAVASRPLIGPFKLNTATRAIASFTVIFIILEVVTRTVYADSFYLPPASTIVMQTVLLLVREDFIFHVASTLQASALGLTLTTVIAVPIGILLGASKVAYEGSRAIIEFVRPVPSAALIPLAVLIFGTGTQMKVALVITAAVWPILFNTIYGVHSVDPVLKQTARTLGLSKFRLLTDVSLPSAAPFIYTGIKISVGLAVIVTISSELLSGSQQGLGVWLLLVQQTGSAPALLYAGTIVTGMIGWLFNWLLTVGERRLFAWQQGGV